MSRTPFKTAIYESVFTESSYLVRYAPPEFAFLGVFRVFWGAKYQLMGVICCQVAALGENAFIYSSFKGDSRPEHLNCFLTHIKFDTSLGKTPVLAKMYIMARLFMPLRVVLQMLT